ncbi:Gfo/Idh/MocA family protein [Aporhodopirellula aestuarii]|uniref:Gfo/Idh/MocA family oxidoreductase n=1 Tax=Aporhodopirellula aestuarii TaxID=2950107 RepID=A0ABT0TWU4_9BACT|nr:Gfo/Idh/MocA family oxidoreductase [Aporhodopirellula aestuarii]MCM2369079.1 Gfo/Idh/MocA family oxidoreductase [Aporhodopirellula aestuarii]
MNSSPHNKTSRRSVLRSIGATTALAASGLLPSAIYAAPPASANDKLRVGLIGAGNRAKWLTRALSRESHRAELVAVCDCYLPQIDVLAADNKNNPRAGDSWKLYQNYEQMFDQEELDAVMIATPDHVRVRAAIIACVKGLDVYAEKPLSFSIPEGRALVEAVQRHKRVLQVGTQQRSTPINQYACEFVRGGGLGKVSTILVKNYSGSRPATGLDQQPIPEGTDWNRFCDQAKLLDYHEQLHRRWRNFNAFTGGPICDRGSHALDMVHLAMGWENVAPTRIEPTTEAKEYWGRGVRLYYPDGTVIRLESTGGPAFGGIFIGQQGKIEINRGRFACNPKDLLAPFNGSETESHVANWLDCIETREQPNAPVEVGHRITSVAHLINICRITGRTINWDATKEQIIGDDAANALLTKERRPEFSLPTV